MLISCTTESSGLINTALSSKDTVIGATVYTQTDTYAHTYAWKSADSDRWLKTPAPGIYQYPAVLTS